MSENIEATVVEDKKSIKSKISGWYNRNQVMIKTTAITLTSALAIGAVITLGADDISSRFEIRNMKDFLSENNLLDKYHDYQIEDIVNIITEE